MNEKTAIDAVLFDMDGVLIDSEPLYAQCMAASARALGFDWSHDDHLAVIGCAIPLHREVMRARKGAAFPLDEYVAGWVARFQTRGFTQGVPLKSGALALLARLDALAIPYAVATSTPHASAVRHLTASGLATDRFRAIIGGDQVARSKPAPDIYVAAAASVGVPITRCLVIEDSEHGANAGLAAHAHVAIVPDMKQPSAALAARARVFSDLETVMRQLFG